MKKALPVTLAVMLFVSAWVLAQAPPPAPKPGPEHKRLAYFIGKWNSEGDAKASAFGPAGKFTGTDHNEWLPGGFFLVMHSDFKGPMGDGKGLAIMGYNAEEKAYTFYAANSIGMAETSKGAVKGDTWTWNSESKMGGKQVKSRFSIKELSPTSYTMKFDTSTGGGPWTTVMEGKATKAK